MKGIAVLLCLVLLSGCVEWMQKPAWFEEDINVKGEIKDLEKKQKEVFRDLGKYYYIWDQAVVDRVKVPSHIRGGAYVPEHEEYVILNPGGFRLKQRPNRGTVTDREDAYEARTHPERVHLRIYRTDTETGVYTSVQKNRVLFMMRNPEIRSVADGGSIKVGRNLYTFRYAGNSVMVAFISNGKLVEERIEPGMVFVTSDGYIIEPAGGDK